MSQSYHCQLQESVKVNVSFGDTVTHSLNLTEILPKEEMVALLREQLIELGFTQDGDRLTLTSDGTTTEVDLDAMEATVSRSGEKQLSATATSTGRSYTRSAAKRSAEQGLSAAVANTRQQLKAEQSRIQREETAAVERTDAEVKEVLHLALQQVYTESLKRKASQLGDVLSIQESTTADGEYELIIQIEQ
ncbi:MAG: hypothetical protein ACI8RZ_006356 [Myxococcota bacterium]|jgi:hypothetical protein